MLLSPMTDAIGRCLNDRRKFSKTERYFYQDTLDLCIFVFVVKEGNQTLL